MGDKSSPVVSMIIREQRLQEDLQQARHDYDGLVEDVRHRMQLLREHIETRRQSLSVAESCDDKSRPASADGKGTSPPRSRAADPPESKFDWIESDDLREGLNQLLRLVEKHHQELDLRQRSLDDDLNDSVVRERTLSTRLKTSQRDLERVTVARDRHEDELAGKLGECEQLSQECMSLKEQLTETESNRDDFARQLNDLQRDRETNLQRIYAELTIREAVEEKVIDLETSATQLQEENRTVGETLARVEHESAEKITQLQADLAREQTELANSQIEAKELVERLASSQEELSAEQARLQASREDVTGLLSAHKELKAEARSMALEAEETEQALSESLEEVRRELERTAARHEGRQRELAALRRQRDKEHAQHQVTRDDWQTMLRTVRQEAKLTCDKAQQQQRQVGSELCALREQHGDLAERCEKLEQENEELRAERTQLKLCLAAAETPGVSRRLTRADGQQIRVDGSHAGQASYRHIRFSELKEKQNQESGVGEK